VQQARKNPLPVHLVVHPAIKAHAAHVTKKTCPFLPSLCSAWQLLMQKGQEMGRAFSLSCSSNWVYYMFYKLREENK